MIKETNKPKYGDKRKKGKCSRCGGDLYEVFDVHCGYSDGAYYWNLKTHTLEDCIESLAKRMKNLKIYRMIK